MQATSGNISEVLTRTPLRVAVTASGNDKGSLDSLDVVAIDVRGMPLAAGRRAARPSAEGGLHAHIVDVTGAGAVVHVHAMASVLAGRRWPAGVPLRDVEMLKALGRAAHGDDVLVPVIANSQDMGELGARLDAVLDAGVPGVVVADHGLYVWGADLDQARHRTEAFEWLLRLALESTRLS
jgi:methylthioribulose-1-phosphate dehydratase